MREEVFSNLYFRGLTIEPLPSWLNQNTKLTSDTHFFHDNIVRYCQRPLDWQKTVVNYWETTVTDQDTIFHLGDVALGSKEDQMSLLPYLPGQKVLLLGNHDRTNREFWNSAGFVEIIKKKYIVFMIENLYVVFSHYPVNLIGWERKPVINIHGHVHNNPYIFQDNPSYVNVGIDVTNFQFVKLGKILERFRKK